VDARTQGGRKKFWLISECTNCEQGSPPQPDPVGIGDRFRKRPFQRSPEIEIEIEIGIEPVCLFRCRGLRCLPAPARSARSPWCAPSMKLRFPAVHAYIRDIPAATRPVRERM